MSKASRSTPTRLLIVGAYGVVGEQIAQLMAREHPSVELWLAGRSREKAAALASNIPGSTPCRVDIDDTDPLRSLDAVPDLILAVANDANNNLLRAALDRNIAYIDITRWTERMVHAGDYVRARKPSQPFLLASGWMAGVVATISAHFATMFDRVEQLEFDVLFALKDKAGPNSFEYADRLRVPFTVSIGGKSVKKMPFSDPKQVVFSGGRTFRAVRFDTPDQVTLPGDLGIPTVASRVTYDDAKVMGFMRFMVGSGIWSVLSLPLFDSLRRSLLFNPGPGAPHEVQITAAGKRADGSEARETGTLVDPLGQTHMTAIGAVLQIERVLGLSGLAVPISGLSYPEKLADPARAVERLKELGLQLLIDPPV